MLGEFASSATTDLSALFPGFTVFRFRIQAQTDNHMLNNVAFTYHVCD